MIRFLSRIGHGIGRFAAHLTLREELRFGLMALLTTIGWALFGFSVARFIKPRRIIADLLVLIAAYGYLSLLVLLIAVALVMIAIEAKGIWNLLHVENESLDAVEFTHPYLPRKKHIAVTALLAVTLPFFIYSVAAQAQAVGGALAGQPTYTYTENRSWQIANDAGGTVDTWTGGGADNKWSTAGNWSGGVPTGTNIAYFGSTSTKDATVDASFAGAISELKIAPGYTGTVSLGRNLNVGGQVVLSGGTLVSNGNTLSATGSWLNYGSNHFSAGTGTVVLAGTGSSQTLSGSTFNNLTLNDGLVGYWKLDDGTGSSIARDSTGISGNGTLYNGPTWSTNSPGTMKFFDKGSMHFDGVDDHVDISGGFTKTLLGRTSYSVSAWVNQYNLGSSTSQGNYFGAGTEITLYSSPGRLFSWSSGAGSAIYEPFSDIRNSWHLLTVSKGPGSVGTAYLDGTPLTFYAGSGLQDTRSNAGNFVIGEDGRFSAGKYFPGYIDDVRVYNRQLSASEVAHLAAGYRTSGSGTYTLGSALTVNGNLNLGDTTLDVSSHNYGITLGGNMQNAGILTPQSGTVTLNGTNQTLSGSTVFYNLTKSVSAAASLFFDYTSQQSVSGALTLNGTAGNLLSVRSTHAGTGAQIILDGSSGTQSLSYLDVKDSDASLGASLTCSNCTDSSNNTNWTFATTTSITGTVYSDANATTPIGSGVKVAVSLNGAAVSGTGTTDAGGQYVISGLTNLTGGTVVALYVSGSSTNKAVTVATGSGGSMTGMTLIKDQLIVRSGTGTHVSIGQPITAGILNAAKASGYGDIAALYSMSSNNLTVTSGKTLNVWTGSTLNLGGTITTSYLHQNGNIVQGNNAMTINTAFTMSGGTFTGSSGGSNFTDNGTFSQSAGTFTATSGTGSYANTFQRTGGSFSHNNGTTKFLMNNTATITTDGATFYDLTFDKTVTSYVTVTLEDAINVAHDVRLQNSVNSYYYNLYGSGLPTMTVNGNMSIASSNVFYIGNGSAASNFNINLKGSLDMNDSSARLNANLTFDGTGAQTVWQTAGTIGAGTWTVDKSSGVMTLSSNISMASNTLHVSTGSVALGGYTLTTGPFTQSGGTFMSGSGAVSVTSFSQSGGVFDATSDTLTVSSGFARTGGTFNHNNGTVEILANGNLSVTSGSPTFYNLIIGKTNTTYATLTLADSFTVAGNLTIQNSVNSYYYNLYGSGSPTITVDGNVDIPSGYTIYIGSSSAGSDFAINVAGDVTMSDSSASLNADLNFDGATNNQIVTKTAGTVSSYSAWTINKTSGTVIGGGTLTTSASLTLDSASDVFSASGTTASSFGAVTISGGTMTSGDNMTVSSINQSGGTWNSLGTFLTDNGAFTQSAGTFNAPSSGIFTTEGTFTRTGGTFNANSSRMEFYNASSYTVTTGGATFYDVLFYNVGTSCCSATTLTLADGFTVTNDLTIQNQTGVYGANIYGSGTPTITVGGNLLLNGSSGYTQYVGNATAGSNFTIDLAGNLTETNAAARLYANVNFDGSTNNQIVTKTAGYVSGGSWTIGKTSGTVIGSGALSTSAALTLDSASDIFTASGSASPSFGAVTLSSGTFTGGSGMTVSSINQSGGTWNSYGQTLTDNGTFTQSAGTFTAPTGVFTTKSTFNRTGGTFNHNDGTMEFYNASSYTVTTGNAAFHDVLFYNVGTSCCSMTTLTLADAFTVANDLTIQNQTNFYGATIVATNTPTLTVGGNLVFNGSSSYAQYLGSATASSNFTINLAGDFTLSNAGSRLYANTVFDGTGTQTITSSAGTLSSPFWYVHKSAGQAVLASALSMSSTKLTLSGGVLSLNGNNLTTSTSGFKAQSGATLRLHGSETVTTPTLNTGSTVLYNESAQTEILKNFTYSNLVIGSTGSAVFNLTGSSITVKGNLTLSGGTLATTNGGTLNLSGAWLKTSAANASFSAGTGTVVLSGGDQTMSGSTTFYNLTKSVSAAQTLTLAATATQTVTHTLTLNGTTGNHLSLRSTQSGTQAKIDPQGSRSISNVDVEDNDNLDASVINCISGCIDSGDNTNWYFAPVKKITGTVYTDTGTTVIGSNVKVAVSLNGGAVSGTGTTDSGGQYTISDVTMTGGTVITLYISGNSAKGATVTLGSGGTMTGVDLYEHNLIVRSDSGSVAITNSDLKIGQNSGYRDITDVYSVDSSNVLTMSQGMQLFVRTGDTYNPGAATNANTLKVLGTMSMSSNVLTVSGSLVANSGTFTTGTGITLDGGGSQTLVLGGNTVKGVTIGDAAGISAASLIGYWKFDDGAGTSAADSSGNSHTATLYGSPTWSSDTPSLHFSDPYSLALGSSKYADAGTATAYNVTGSNFTISAWIKLNTNTSHSIIAAKADSSYGYQFLVRDGAEGGKLVFDYNGASSIFSSSSAVTTGSWHQVAVTGNGLYLDGTKTAASISIPNSSSNPLTFGKTNSAYFSSTIFDGNIDDMRLYGRSLTDAEITQLSQGYGNGGSAGPNRTYLLGSALTVNGDLTIDSGSSLDVSGSNYDLTLTGSLINKGPAADFNARNGAVILGGGNQTLSGALAFYDLRKTVTSPATLSVSTDGAKSVSGSLVLHGTVGNLLSLRSTMSGSAANFYLNASATQLDSDISELDVKDMDASNGQALYCYSASEGCVDSGNNTNWFFIPPKNITGFVYTDTGATTAGSNIKVAVSLNGGAVSGTGTTDAGGQYTISNLTMTGGTVVTLYISGNSAKGVTVTLGSGGTMTGMNLFENNLIVRSDSGSVAMTNGYLKIGQNNGYADIRSIYNVDGSNTLQVAAGKQLWVWIGDTFTPGGLVKTTDLYDRGTMTMSSYGLTVTGSLVTELGTFTTSTGVTLGANTTSETLSVGNNTLKNLTINNGLIGYWKLDDGTGSTIARDSSGNGNNGTLTNEPTWSMDAPSTRFYDPKSLHFDGTNDYVDIGSSARLIPPSSAFSLSWWDSVGTSPGTYEGLFAWATGSKHFLVFRNGTDFYVTPHDGTNAVKFSGVPSLSTANTWHHWTIVGAAGGNSHTTSDYQLYVDGVKQGSGISSTTGNSSTQINDIGTDGFDTSWKGNMDDIRIYNRALSASEIAHLANGYQNTGSGVYVLGSNLSLSGNLNIVSGGIDAGSNKNITMSGNLLNVGEFDAQNGTVTLDGGNQTMSGDTVFYNLTKNVTTAASLFFDYTGRQSASGALTLNGASSNLLSIRSTHSGTGAHILLDGSAGTQSLSYLDVQDSNAESGATLSCTSNCTDSGNNTNWSFAAPTVTWTGGGSDNNWSTAGNWSTGVVPTSTDNVVFDSTGKKNATVDASFAGTVNSITIAKSYTGSITLSHALTVNGDLTDSGSNTTGLTWTAGAQNNLHVVGNMTVNSGATVTVAYSSLTGNGSGQNIIVDGSLTVATGATITAVGQGFAAAQGPGAGKAPSYGAGTHGGMGAVNTLSTYGSMTNPTELGSGGWHQPGGGSIQVHVGGTLTVNGVLTANGKGASGNNNGAGGSINITATTLNGSGSITANGGDGGTYNGGGGRISLANVTTDAFKGTLQAKGGSNGFAGTIYLNSADRTSLTIGGTGHLRSLRLGSDGTNNYTFGDVIIQSGGTLEMDGNPSMHSNQGGAATLNATNVTVQTGGLLSANNLGFRDSAVNSGPGGGIAPYYGGGTYGGSGGANPTSSYGSLVNPLNMGSAGYDSIGGGAVIINASNAVTINGSITANGEGGSGVHAGAGGTVNITAATVSGNGAVKANGGSGYHGGGGGRIAIVLTSGISFGNTTYQAYGATANVNSAAGTIYKKAANQTYGDVIVDNNSVSAIPLRTVIMSGATVGSMTVQNSGVVLINTGVTLNILGTGTVLTVKSGTAFTNSGTLILGGTGSSIAGTFTTDEVSTVNYVGQSNHATAKIINTVYNKLGINGANTTFQLPSSATNLNVFGNLTLTGGTLAVTNANTITLSGSWIHSGGSFNAGTGTVMMIGQGNTSINETSSFNNLTFGAGRGLVGYWKFDDGTGATAVDSSGNGNNGTLVNGPTWSTDVPTTRFHDPYSLSFNGTSNYVSVPVGLSGSGTISFWAKGGPVSNYPSWVNDAVSNNALEFGYIGSTIFIKAGPGLAGSYSQPSDGAWHLYTLTSNGTTGKLYIGGVYQTSASFSFASSSLYIAKGYNYFGGLLDDVRIYNRALTAAEVSALANGNQLIGSGTYTMGAALAMSGSLDIENGNLDASASNYNITVGGNYTNYGTLTTHSNTVTLKGTGNNYTMSGALTFNNLTLNNGLVGYWKLDDGTGSSIARDSSGNGNNGTLTNGPTWSTSVPNTRFYDPKSLHFDGVDDYVSVPDSSALQLSNHLTVATWVKSTTAGSDIGIIRKDTQIGTRYLWGLAYISGVIQAQYYNGTVYRVSSSTANDNVWRHAVMTINGTTMTLYINGVSQGTATISGTQGIPTGEMDIGAEPPAIGISRTSYMIGSLDDVRIYNRALSASEVSHLASGYQNTGSGNYVLGAALTVNGNLNIVSGNLDASASNYGVTAKGNWSNVGNFTPHSDTVTLSTTANQTLSGSTIFWNLTKLATNAASLFFDYTGRQSASGSLNLMGVQGGLLKIRSTATGTGAHILLDGDSGTQNLRYLDVKDSDATGGATLTCHTGDGGCADSGNNTNWSFSRTYNITGTVYSNTGGTTPLTGVKVAVSLNGAAVSGTGTVDNGGQFTIGGISNLTGGTVVALYISGSTNKAVTVSTGSGGSMTGMTLIKNQLIVRSGTGTHVSVGAPVTSAMLTIAKATGYSDITSLYSMSSNNLTVTTGKTVNVWTGSTLNLGGTLTTSYLHENGNMIQGNNALTINSAFTMSGGTFTGSNGGSAITDNGTFNQDAGTFVATSGTGTFANDFIRTGGTFTHNSGTLTLAESNATTFTTGGAILYNLTLTGHGTCGDSNKTTTFADSFTVSHTLTVQSTTGCSGYTHVWSATSPITITLQGDFTESQITGFNETFGNANVTLQMTGAGPSFTVASGAFNANLNVNGTGTATLSRGGSTSTGTTTINQSAQLSGDSTFYDFTISSGKTLDVSNDGGVTSHNIVVAHAFTNAGTFTARSGTLTFSHITSTSITSGGAAFYDLTLLGFASCVGGTSTTTFLDSFTVSHNLTIQSNTACSGFTHIWSASNPITIALSGNFAESQLTGYNETFGNSNVTLKLTGGSAQTIALRSGTFSPQVVIAKSANTVTLSGALVMNTTGQNLVLTGGTLDLNGNNLTVNKSLIIGTGTTLRLHGDETLSYTNFLSQLNSTVWYDSAGSSAVQMKNIPYQNVIIGSTGSTVFNPPNSQMTLSGALTISGGTLNVNGGQTITLSGSWLHTGGTFNSGTGTVIMRNVGASTLTESQPFNNVTINNGLVGYWKMDDGTGSSIARDSSGNGNNGTLTNGPTWSTSVPSTRFYDPKSLHFDGVDDYVATNVRAINGTAAFTFGGWIKFERQSSTYEIPLWNGFDSATSGFGFIRKPNSPIVYAGWGSSNGEVAGPSTTNGVWYHVMSTYNGTTQRFYVNGVSQGTTSYSNSNFTSGLTTLGNLNSASSYWFRGNIDDVRIYNRALSASEVAHLADGYQNSGSGVVTLGANLDVNGNLQIADSTLDPTSSNRQINLAGNLLDAGSITQRNNNFILDGTNQTISGSTLFYNFTKAVSSAAKLFFDPTSRQSFSGALAINGAASNLLSIRSTTSGTGAHILLDGDSGTQSLSYLDVKDSDATGGATLVCHKNSDHCTDSGNNVNWNFANSASATGSIVGYVWYDDNGNGVRTGDESTGFNNVTVTLSGSTLTGALLNLTTTTNSLGQYAFSGTVISGSNGYAISIDPSTLSGTYLRTTFNSTGSNVLGTGAVIRANFGYVSPSTLTGSVFVDSDSNGLKAVTETQIFSGTIVELSGTTGTGGTISLTTKSNASGTYIFSNLPTSSGSFVIAAEAPTGYTTTSTNSRLVSFGTGGQIKNVSFGYLLTPVASSSSAAASSSSEAGFVSGGTYGTNGTYVVTIVTAPQPVAEQTSSAAASSTATQQTSSTATSTQTSSASSSQTSEQIQQELQQQIAAHIGAGLEYSVPIVAPIIQALGEIQSSVTQSVQTGITQTKGISQNIAQSVQDLTTLTSLAATSASKSIASSVGNVGQTIGTALQSATQSTQAAVTQIASTMQSGVSAVTQSVTSAAQVALQTMQDTSELALNRIEQLGTVGQTTAQFARTAGQSIADMGTLTVATTQTAINSITQTTGAITDTTATTLSQTTVQIAQSIADATDQTTNALQDAAQQLADATTILGQNANELAMQTTTVTTQLGQTVADNLDAAQQSVSDVTNAGIQWSAGQIASGIGAMQNGAGILRRSGRDGIALFALRLHGAPTQPPASAKLPPPQTYTTTIKKNTDGQTLVATLAMSVFDSFGHPYANTPVVLFSTPKIAVTNSGGIATFHDVETGKHQLEIHVSGGTVEKRDFILEPPSVLPLDTQKELQVALPVIQVMVSEPVHGAAPVGGIPIYAWIIIALLAGSNVGWITMIIIRKRDRIRELTGR
ncbi:MAG TPA: LamG-like jellyroll fold domain-containing protein [Candidatus Peribacteraceae bacterium]|nr:LamG-like jellyroll fold domain-containing protein [Candidatus Peribacteraceae bacterium]